MLDTGFFAVSAEESGRKSYWGSDDGRTWTEMIGVPTEIHDSETTSWGDHVYLSHRGAGTGYTSTDGGRTWIAGSRRPGVGLAVADARYVTTQPAVFATGVSGVVWVSSDDVDWQRVVNPWPPLEWTFNPVISGNTILVPGETDPPPGERWAGPPARIDLVGFIRATD